MTAAAGMATLATSTSVFGMGVDNNLGGSRVWYRCLVGFDGGGNQAGNLGNVKINFWPWSGDIGLDGFQV